MKQLQERVYFENLDALRFLAALAVMGEHISRSFYFPDTVVKKYFLVAISLDGSGGEWGVSFFFVLSGFLITHLLLREFQQTETIALTTFYLRRTWRIWPLYWVVLLIGFVIHPLLDSSLHETASPLLYAIFMANFDNMYGAWNESGILGVQWSLAIEEQFYLLWPIVILWLAAHRRYFLPLVRVLIFVSLFYRLNGGHKYHTLSGAAPLMCGAALAYISLYQKKYIDRWVLIFSRKRMVVLYIFFFLVLVFNYRISKFFGWGEVITVVGFPIMSVWILTDQVFSKSTYFQPGRWKWATLAGKMSYGIYSLHMVAIVLVSYRYQHDHLSFWVAMIGIVLLTCTLVVLSYYFLEKPLLKRRPPTHA